MSRLHAALALVVLLCGAAAADERTAYEDLHRTDARLQLTLLGGGAVSIAGGAVLCGFSHYDHALQVAGGVTLAFGAADLAGGIAGYLAVRREAKDLRARGVPREDLLRLSEKKGVVFAVNLGLDAGFVFAGLTAVAASQLGVDHRERWLAGGLAAVVQGVLAGAVDLIGMLASRRAHRRAGQ